MTSPSLAFAKKTSAGTGLRSEWQQVRDMFSFREGSIPMNAANLFPSFNRVAEKDNLSENRQPRGRKRRHLFERHPASSVYSSQAKKWGSKLE